MVDRMFVNGLAHWGLVRVLEIPKIQKLVLDDSLLNTNHRKIHFKGK